MKMKGIGPILHHRLSGWKGIGYSLCPLLPSSPSSSSSSPLSPHNLLSSLSTLSLQRISSYNPSFASPPRLYHPRKLYIVHLDLESPSKEWKDLLEYVAGHSLFEKVGNVRMITRANLVTYRGPTMVANYVTMRMEEYKKNGFRF